MSKTITIDIFDPASIDRAVREIREYSKWVQDKTVELRKRIAERIRRNAQVLLETDSVLVDVDINEVFSDGADVGDVTVEDNGDISVIIAHGKDVIFIEFGAGVYYNGAVGSSPHPWGTELGFTIGSYGNGNGRKEVWGYLGEDGQIHLTHGTIASMPLYKAVQDVLMDIVEIAREVFASD